MRSQCKEEVIKGKRIVPRRQTTNDGKKGLGVKKGLGFCKMGLGILDRGLV